MENRFTAKQFQIRYFIFLLFFIQSFTLKSQSPVAGIDSLIFKKSASSYSQAVTKTFYLHKMEVNPTNLQLNWNAPNKTFTLTGTAKINLKYEELFVSFGDTILPGLIIKADTLNYVNANITSSFNLKGIKITPLGLGIAWNRTENYYGVYGTIKVNVESDSIEQATLGTISDPGIRITNGKIEHISIGLTARFKLKSLELIPNELTFNYDTTGHAYKIFGSLQVKVENDTLKATLGNSINPGISIANGVIKHINFGVTARFKLKSVELFPENLTFNYDKAKSAYKIYGSLNVKFETDSLYVTLGDSIDPGMSIANGVIEHINFGVTTEFSLKTLQIKPIGLRFEYDTSKQSYSMFGSLKTVIESDSLTATLGTDTSPGLEIRNGQLDKIDLDITSDFKLKGLDIRTDSLGLSWTRNANAYHLYGKINVYIKEDKVGFSFGTKNSPGLIYENKKIKYLKFSTNADLHFGGLEVGSKEFSIEYKDSEYHAYGLLFVKEIWSAALDLGSGSGSGVTLNTEKSRPEFKINKATLSLGNVDLASFKVKEIAMTLQNNEVIDVKAKLEFKPGWTVGGELKFISYKLNSVEIDWKAATIKEAVAIPGTGAFVMSMKGHIENFRKPHDFKFTGTMGIFVGGEFKIGNRETSFVYLDANVSMNRKELIISDDAYIGAFMDKSGKWESVFGKGNMKLDLKWGSNYTLKGHLNIPEHNTILTTTLNAKLSKSGAFNSLLDVSLTVPKSIPVIGGHKFGHADGAIHYKKNDNGNFIAGWVTINLVFKKLHTGVKYNFKDEKFTHIGSGSISDIKKIVKVAPSSSRLKAESQTPSPQLHWDKFKISVNEGVMPHYIQVRLKLKQTIDSVFTRTTAPVMYGNQNYVPCYYVNKVDSLNDESLNIKMLTTHNYLWSKNKNEITFFILPVGYDTEIGSRLAAGDYWLETANTVSTNIIDLDSIEVRKIFEKPRVEYQNIKLDYTRRISDPDSIDSLIEDLSWNINLKAETSNPDSTEVHLLFSKGGNDSNIAYSGLYKDMENLNSEFRKTTTIVNDLNPNDSLLVWAVIDDKINPIVTTEQVKLNYTFSIKGKISIVNEPDSAASGIGVKILLLGKDNKWYSLNDTIVNHTTHNGQFGFVQQVTSGTQIQLKIEIPYGYEVDPSSIMKPNTTYTINALKGFDFGTIYLKETSN